MKKRCRFGMKRATAAVLSAALLTSMLSVLSSVQVLAQDSEDYTSFVNPFVGTAVDNGQLFPGSVVPYGLVKLSPDTYPHSNDDHAGYDYNKNQIEGFSHTRIEGVGGQGAGGDVLITPTYIDFQKKPTALQRTLKYTHADETASPGYYSVDMTARNEKGVYDTSMGKLKAEMTSDTRTGYHRYTFPKAGKMGVTVDLNYTYHGTDIRNATLNIEKGSGTALSGRFSGRNVSGHGKYTMYFYMETSKPMTEIKTWNGSSFGDSLTQAGNDIGAVLYMDGEAGEELELKVSISPISVEQAKRDMHKESPTWDFEAMRQSAKDQWNDVLGKVKVESSAVSDPDGSLKKLFYTHLYHMFTTPVNATSTDNTFRATDGNIYEANNYTHYDSWTLWDDFRKYPMIGLVWPEVYKDIIHSIADTMEYGIGTWGLETQPVPTVRTEHAVALLADGVAKGYTDIPNLEAAYNKAKEIAGTKSSSLDRVDTSVEYSYDDWCISLLAKALGKTSDYETYTKRSFNYKNLFRSDAVTLNDGSKSGLLWPKNNDGSWKNADPEQYGNNGLYQGTLWQYTFWDSNDVTGLVELMGGKDNFLKAVSRLYGQNADGTFLPETNPPGRNMLHSNTNEIDLHTPYLFNFAGKPSRTQYWVRQIYTKETWNRYSGTGEYNPPRYEKAYRLAPDGFMQTMDDDAGTMASMYVAAAMGLFPMTPGDTSFQIGSPFFEKVTLDVGNGKTFTIKANGVSPDNFYVQSASLNGRSFDRTWVDYSEITRGGVLEFNMGSKASAWAEDGVPAPSSSDKVDTAVYDSANALSYSTSEFEESAANDGSIGNAVEVTLKSGTAFAGTNGAAIGSDKIAVTNVPAGLTPVVTKVSDQKISIALTGKAASHELEDSVGSIKVELKDAAFTKSVESSYRVRSDVKIRFSDSRIEYSADKVNENKADDGSISETVALTLTGGAKFSGNNGDDLAAQGKVVFQNLPDGLTAKVVRTGDTAATLSFTGKAVSHNYSTGKLGIAFQDAAFADGVLAAQVMNSSRSGMNALVLNFTQDITSKLREAVDEALALDQGQYAVTTARALAGALQNAQEKIAAAAGQTEMESALAALKNAMNKLVRRTDGFDRLEGEASDTWSGGELKNEPADKPVNLGGVKDGSWVGYQDLYFGNKGIVSLSVRYDNNSSRCASDARIEVRLGSSTGRLITTVELPATGSSWGTYETVTVDFDDPSVFAGTQDVYLVFKGTEDGGHPFICNLDYVKFDAKGTYGRFEAERYDAWSENGLKTEHNSKNNLDNLGATYDGAWLAYYDKDFTGEGLQAVNVHYANNSGRCAPDAKIEIRKDSADGELIATVPIPAKDGSWDTYQTATLDLSAAPYYGSGDIYVVLKGDTSKNPYICNLDYVEFVTKEVVNKTKLKAAIDAAQGVVDSGVQADYSADSWNTLTEKLTAAKTAYGSDDATAELVKTRTDELIAAMNGLKKLLSAGSITVSSIPAQEHTGSAVTPKPVVKDGDTTLKEGTDYTLSYQNNVNPGTATITIAGMGDYAGTKDVTFTIKEKATSSEGGSSGESLKPDDTSSDKTPSGDTSSDKKPSGDTSSEQTGSDHTPSDETPSDDHPSDGSSNIGNDSSTGGSTSVPVTGDAVPAIAALMGVLSLGVFGMTFAVKKAGKNRR